MAPHPDDDILCAAGVAASAVAQGATVKVVYMTNGDYYDGVSGGLGRENDAVRAQTSFIGTSENDLIFLGYPDSGLWHLRQDYAGPNDLFTTWFGQSSTYGDRGLGLSDYHFYRFGQHAAYNGANVLQDLDSILATYRPDDIYTIGPFDEHPDHQATYSFVRAALVARMASDPSYSPTLHTTIVHWQGDTDSWPAPTDPQTDMVEPPGLAQTGLSWDARESLVVPLSMQNTNLAANPKYLALDAHGHQLAVGWLGRFIHRDEVFWVDSLAPTAAAGPDQNVIEQSLAQLDGSASSDSDGDPLTYAWTQTAGPAVTLSDASAARPSFTAPAAPASLSFQLVVNDGHVASTAASVTITVAPMPSLSINDASVTEGNSGSRGLVFTLSLSAPSGLPVSVSYATANGTALAGSDYTAASGTLTFAPGVTTQTVSVAVLGDLRFEADETFAVNLSGAQNATIADNQGLGTIVNDDPMPAPSVLTATAAGSPLRVTLGWVNNISAPLATGVTVQRATNASFTTNVTTFPALAPTSRSYADSTVALGTTYFYRVRAVGVGAIVSAWSNTASVAAGPTAPTNLRLTSRTTRSLSVAWTNNGGATSNVVQYSMSGSGGPWTTRATLSATVTSYTITSLQTRHNYWVRVLATSVAGQTPSNVLATRTL